MPTIADIAGASRLGLDTVFAVAGKAVPRNGREQTESKFDGCPVVRRAISPGHAQAV